MSKTLSRRFAADHEETTRLRPLLSGSFHGRTDAWTEHLCVEVLPGGQIEVTSRSHEVLMYDAWAAGPVVWPDGFNPDEDADEAVLPLSVDGKPVRGRDGCAVVGRDLLVHSDDARVVLQPGDSASARSWLDGYGWSRQRGFDQAWEELSTLLEGSLS